MEGWIKLIFIQKTGAGYHIYMPSRMVNIKRTNTRYIVPLDAKLEGFG